MQTNQQLELAANYVQFTGQNIFLTGKAGTGKTTFLRRLRENPTKRMVVVAPTGVAAVNARGVTIHSFFQLPFGPLPDAGRMRLGQMRFNKEKINIIRSLDLLVIDEISMVRADLLDAVDAVLRRFRTQSKPFGGVQLLMIGDLQQLPPVVKDDERDLLRERYETPYFFSSEALRKTSFVSIELTHVFRQQDEQFIALLNKVRENHLDTETLDTLNQRHIPDFQPDDKEGYVILCTHNIQAQHINESRLAALPGDEHRFRATIEGNFPEYSYPTESELLLKKDAQVMFVKNDSAPEKLFYNGKIGKIVHIEDHTIHVLCPGESNPIAVSPMKWENVRYSLNETTNEISETIEGSFIQYPLKPAWAITIHKSQGLTFERAIIDAQASFAHGQVYVALSRCKTLEGMVLSTPLRSHSIINDQTVSGFTQAIAQHPPDAAQLQSARVAYQQELLLDLFQFTPLRRRILYIEKIISENPGSIPIPTQELLKQIYPLVQEMITIADKFHIQISRLLPAQPDVERNTVLQERIALAAGYFSDKIKTSILDPLSKADLDIDNKAVRKQLTDAVDRLELDSRIKHGSLLSCLSGFQVGNLLRARAEAAIEKTKPKEPRRTAPVTIESTPHPILFDQLRAWRKEKAIEMNVPVFGVFSQKTLYELAEYLPIDGRSLQKINGIGPKKISQFGAEIIEIIQEYYIQFATAPH
jgi:GTPase SAR1 family protein